jgi:hypothetical protein
MVNCGRCSGKWLKVAERMPRGFQPLNSLKINYCTVTVMAVEVVIFALTESVPVTVKV